MGCDMSFIKKAAQHGKKTGALIEKRFLLLGLDNAGKSSLLAQLKDREFKETTPTIGLNIENISYQRYDMTFWDVGGQATKLWKHYFDSIDTIIFVIDSTDREKLIFAREELAKLQQDEDLVQVPFLVLYNKSDLGDECMSKEELDSRIDIKLIMDQRPVNSAVCSAQAGTGIWEALDLVVAYFEHEHGFDIDKSHKKAPVVFEKGTSNASASTTEGRKPTVSSDNTAKKQ